MANKYKKSEEKEPEFVPEVEPEVEETEESKEADQPKRRQINPKLKGISTGYRDILGGDILTKGAVIKQLPFIFLLFALVVVYIYNNNLAEKNLIKIERTKKELIELRYEYISSKSDMMDSLKQSMVQKKLESLGIKEPTNPPHKIYINTTNAKKE